MQIQRTVSLLTHYTNYQKFMVFTIMLKLLKSLVPSYLRNSFLLS